MLPIDETFWIIMFIVADCLLTHMYLMLSYADIGRVNVATIFSSPDLRLYWSVSFSYM